MYTGIVYLLKCEPSQCIIYCNTYHAYNSHGIKSRYSYIYIKPTLNTLFLLHSRTEIFAFFKRVDIERV